MIKNLYNNLMDMVIDDSTQFDIYHKYEKGIICAEIDLSEFDEEILTEEQQKAGEITLPKYGICVIEVYPNEGDYFVHFHIKSKHFDRNNAKKNLNCCIRINDNSFFDHGSKTDKLPKSVMKKLDKFLDEPSKIDPSRTNWKYIQDSSYNFNPNLKEEKADKKPDYTNMYMFFDEIIIADNIYIGDNFADPCKIVVRGNGGIIKIPHFDLIGADLCCSICLSNPNFIWEGTIGRGKNTLTYQERVKLNEILKEKETPTYTYNYWQTACKAWNDAEPYNFPKIDYDFYNNLKNMPNYSKKKVCFIDNGCITAIKDDSTWNYK